MSPSRTQTILASAATFSALSLLPKILVVAKDAVVAFYFGAGHILDVYLMAFVLIGMPVSIIVVALQTTLIPALIGKNSDTAAGLLGGTLKLALIALFLALPLWLWVLPHTLSALYPGAHQGTLSGLQEATYWLIPYYFLNGINLLLYGALQARKVFWPNAILPGLFPIAMLVTVWFFQGADIRALLIGTVTGSFLECIVLYAMTVRTRAIRWRKTTGSGLRPVLRKALPLMVGGVVTSLGPVVEQMIAFRLGTGAVSLLNYGNKVPAAFNTLLVTAIGIVVLPHFADLITSRQWRDCRTLHFRISGIVLVVGIIVSAIGIALAEDIIRLLFERGAFRESDSLDTANVMRAYLLQLPFLLAAMVSLRILAAMGKTWAMTSVAGAQLVLAGSLAYLLSEHFGVTGVALGSAAATVTGAVLLGLTARYEFRKQITGKTI